MPTWRTVPVRKVPRGERAGSSDLETIARASTLPIGANTVSHAADLLVNITDLVLMIPTTALDAVREYLAKAIDRLALPRVCLVRMNLALRGDLLQRLVPRNASSTIRAFSSPENLRLLLIAYPYWVEGIHL